MSFYDSIPIPSKGLFYDGNPEYLRVNYLTTEDELMLTSPNLFHKGDVLNELLEKNVCSINNIKLGDLLINDKEFILLYIKETAYGNVTQYQDEKEKLYFDTHNIKIKTIDSLPEKDGFYHLQYDENTLIKTNFLKVKDEKFLKSSNKLDYYINHIYSINDNTDRNYIKRFFEHLPILKSKKIKNFIDDVSFGVNKKTFCIFNDKTVDIEIQIDESLFGLTQDNINKKNKSINDIIFFLTNEGEGFTYTDILNMPVHTRRFHEEKLLSKIKRINDEIKSSNKR